MPKFLNNCLLLLVVLKCVSAQTQHTDRFQSPLTIPLFLSGNFGELRTNHFHAGIDMKTEGVSGKAVLAANAGYISRIKIQSGGYGNSLYITHPDGYTTLYAHLDRFIPEVQDYVQAKQYAKKTFEIELFPGSSQFVFEQGDLIAYSGNSGRSGGPHLHFEIRKTNGQVPQNGLFYNFPIADNKPPQFKSLFLYAFTDPALTGNNGELRKEFKLTEGKASSYTIKDTLLTRGAYLGFGTEVYDFLNGSANKCGVYRLELFVNEELVYGFRIDEMSFSHTRYINTHMDYEIKSVEGRNVHRLFSFPNNKLPIYYGNAAKGMLTLQEDKVYNIRIDAYDAYSNKSVLDFRLERDADTLVREYLRNESLVNWKQGMHTKIDNYEISIPSGALYRSVYLDMGTYIDSGDIFKDSLYFHRPSEPLHKYATLSVGIGSIDVELRDKLVLARVNGGGELTSEGGELLGDELQVKTRNFGKYVLKIDSVGPEIRGAGFISGAKYIRGQRMQFEVFDELSGLNSYSLYIDGEWALLEYDAKSDLMTYRLDPSRIEAGKKHTLEIHATDKKNNRSEYHGEFIY